MLTAAQPHLRRGVPPIAALLLAGSAACTGQAVAQPIVVSPQVRMSPASEAWQECSVAVSQTNKNEVFVISAPGPPRYATFFWGVSTAPTNGVLNKGSRDAFATPHPTDGTIWFTALGGFGQKPIVGWKAAGAPTVLNANVGFFDTSGIILADKPTIPIGAWPAAPTGYRYYVLRERRTTGAGECTDTHHQIADFSEDAFMGPGSWSWTEPSVEPDPAWPDVCDYLGWSGGTVALDSGRIVSAIADHWLNGSSTWRYNDGKPYVVWSDDGIDWKSDDPDNSLIAIAPGSVVYAADIQEDCSNICPNDCGGQDTLGASCSTCGDTPKQVDRRKNAPSIAVDRSPEAPFQDHVYVAFYAKSGENTSNTDLFIAKSLNGGETFDNLNLLHITDAMLGLTPTDYNPDQMVPAIAIDSCGGVNVMFYDNRHDTDPDDCEYWVDVYYARITQFDTTPTVNQWRLTPQSIRVDNITGFLGDYHTMTVSADGKTLYGAYISRDNAAPETGIQTCYLHRINLYCDGPVSDFNGDGGVTEADLTSYMTEYSAGESSADLDLDLNVDVNDFMTYVDWYNAEHGE